MGQNISVPQNPVLIKAGKHWLVSSDLNYSKESILTSINDQGQLKSTLKITLTPNDLGTSIYNIKIAFERRGAAVALIIERLGTCHLVCVTRKGEISKLETIFNIVPDSLDNHGRSCDVVRSIPPTSSEAQFIVGGFLWIKQLTLKLC